MPQYRDLREFIQYLESIGHLKRINTPISPKLQITEISQRTLAQDGPALLFENPIGSNMPILTNLFGHMDRICIGMNQQNRHELRELGHLLAFLKEPNPPKSLREAWQSLPIVKQLLNFSPKEVKGAPCQEVVIESNIDLSTLPIQTCWPQDAGPLITWGLVITQNPETRRYNTGIYRQQVIAPNKVIMRWLAHRGGALDYQLWQKKYPNEPFPISVAIGCDPATILAAVFPLPDSFEEHAFAGILRQKKTQLTRSLSHQMLIPASSEIVLEGYIYPGETAQEGPFGDHTGYYNEVEAFPVFTIEKITHRRDPIYHSTHTGRPPDEPAVLGVALNEIYVPVIQKQFPEIVDFYLPPEGCSYRMAVVSIKKQYAGHARRIMMGVWSALHQFMYTKWVIVVDEDINVRSWTDVMWAVTTRMDPKRDTLILENTPIDYLDFASPSPSLGSKIGLDATNKWADETTRVWGTSIQMDTQIIQEVDALWDELDIQRVAHAD